MLAYFLRRLAYAATTLFGVNVAIFLVFFLVNPPDAMARRILGEKASQATIEAWKQEHGYDLPRFYNRAENGAGRLTQTIFFQKSMKLFWFDFGKADRSGDDIASEIRRRIPASLSYAVPVFLLSLYVQVVIAMLVAFYRGTVFDTGMLFFCVILMSISSLFYIIGGQFLFGIHLKLAPISGYDTGLNALKFLVLPILVGLATSFGQGVRFNRTAFLEEINRDYVRTARAKGLSEQRVLFGHVLKNAMIPILTAEVIRIPFLFMGALLTEAFFAIPGLGGYTIQAIDQQDFAIVRAMVYLGALLYVIGQILTDISYTLVDPRVKLA